MDEWNQKNWNEFELDQDQWETIDDHLFNKRIVKGYAFLREVTKMPLTAIMEFCHERHLYLRQIEADKFICSYEDYYNGVYT